MEKLPAVFAVVIISGILWTCLFIVVEKYTRTPHILPKYSNVEDQKTKFALILQNSIKTLNATAEYKPTYVQTYKKNWKGQCSYPTYIPQKVQEEPWFPLYLSHLQRVDFSTSSKARQPINCARWWYPTPQITYDEVPHRKIGWKPKPLPKPGYVRPTCTFGQKSVPRTRCANIHEKLWKTFDKLGILYFPRSGTELGILRGSSYLTTDGDLDIFVDMPQVMLLKVLGKVLNPPPRLSGKVKHVKTETHWRVRGCASVHMVFNDWFADELVNDFGRPTHMDTCECMMNSVKMTCHKEALRRIYVQYGPSWRVPLHAKALDVPHRGRNYNIVGKLRSMVSKDGIIYEKTVRALDPSVEYDKEEMRMILAQLNVLKSLIDYQRRTKKYSVV